MRPDGRDTIYLENTDLYLEIIENCLLNAKEEVWIATANLKDMRIKYKGKFVSIVKLFSELVFRNVSIRLIHSSNPSKAYLSSLKRSTLEKQKNFKRIQCPRVHFKTVIVDHSVMYLGSANFTGAGLGFKSEKNRNFETGMLITDPVMIRNVEALYEKIWSGSYCKGCGRRGNCPKPLK